MCTKGGAYQSINEANPRNDYPWQQRAGTYEVDYSTGVPSCPTGCHLVNGRCVSNGKWLQACSSWSAPNTCKVDPDLPIPNNMNPISFRSKYQKKYCDPSAAGSCTFDAERAGKPIGSLPGNENYLQALEQARWSNGQVHRPRVTTSYGGQCHPGCSHGHHPCSRYRDHRHGASGFEVLFLIMFSLLLLGLLYSCASAKASKKK